MNKKLNVIWFTMCFVVLLLQGTTFAEVDFANRSELDIAGPLSENISWGWKLETEINSDVQSASAINLLARLFWKPLANLSITPELLYGTKGGNPQGTEWRPRIGIEGSKKFSSITLAIRGRVEYRMKESSDNYFRHRARLKLKFPETAGLKLFVYDELFYEAGLKNELNANEAGIGAGIGLRDAVSLCLDLRMISSKSDNRWSVSGVHLLTTFEIRF